MRSAVSRVLRVDYCSAALFRIAVLLIAFGIAGCGVRLAPDYDRTIVDGLAKINESAMTLFAAVSGGSSRAGFRQRERQYDELIGRIDALLLEAKVRPNPRTPPVVGAILGARGGNDPQAGELPTAPTPDVLEKMKSTFMTMRETDSKQNMPFRTVGLFKGEFEIAMRQALRYERALER